MERIFWSIAFPGFGQFLNGKYIKGITFIILELVINVRANFNEAIYYSFLGKIEKASETAEIGWLMFYPCIYFFAMWDAFKDNGGGKHPLTFLPFAFCAYSVTVGIMYYSKIEIAHYNLGPVFLPMLFVIPGLLIGLLLKILLSFLLNVKKEQN
ncbi:hypothetical protein [Priestia endophytica]|jgi:hypothetical protein|uniref:hypothetical protein n=1 Tax=Priestia endophytica TaxID=135735 RepID=UPI000F549E37|nr:hypothetical protein [Priestia endophytica]MED4072583.1 hypothetical protein [Priestia endophytica]RPK12896.1 hypothetical protein FH5_03102 [Priestia endophytica]